MKVLFICHANICRSFMAQELLKQLRPQWQVFSRGLYADPGYVVPEKVFAFLARYDIRPTAHVSTQLTPQDLETADYIFFMERAHLEKILDRYAQYTDKCYLLQSFAWDKETDIADPIGLSGRAFDKAATALAKAVEACAVRLS